MKQIRMYGKYFGLIMFIIVVVAVSHVAGSDTYAYGQKEYTDAQRKFFEEVYEHMVNRDVQFEVSYRDNSMEWDVEDIYYVLAQIDSPATDSDYDYLRGNISEIECVSTHSFFKGTTVSFNILWLEDRSQTEEVSKEIDKILSLYDVDKMSEYEKVKFVHDYIVNNVSYDKSKTYFSAFDGLFRGETVCQGFALLTYRMLTQAGVRSRYIVGKYIPKGSSDGENHAWNMVKLGDCWYYLDTTWDACRYSEVKTENSMRSFFLKGSGAFDTEHIPDEVENGDDFRSIYNISIVDYAMSLGGGHRSSSADDDAVTPHEFFRKKGDGTASSSSKILAFFDNIYNIVTTRFIELVVGAGIIVVLVKVVRRYMEERQ